MLALVDKAKTFLTAHRKDLVGNGGRLVDVTGGFPQDVYFFPSFFHTVYITR